MNYVESLLELSIEEDSIEEYRYRTKILQEFNYSKQDLQDPEILKKILEETKKGEESYQKWFTKIMFCLSTALSLITGILTKSIKIGIVSYAPFTLVSIGLADSFLRKIFYTNNKLNININELKTKVTKLKEKSEKLQDKESAKKIIDNCNKVLDTIDKYETEQKKKKEKEIKDKNARFENYINKPYYEDDFAGEFRNILQSLYEKKIPASDVVNSLIKNYKYLRKENAFEGMYGTDEEEKINNANLYKKYKSIADKDGNVYSFTANDDNIDFVSSVTHKLYTITTDDKIEVIPNNIYKHYHID